MADKNERPRPHGDPLEEVVERNQAQRQSDAPPDAVDSADESSDRADGRGSTANGIPASDEDSGESRRRLYKEGAGLVSKID